MAYCYVSVGTIFVLGVDACFADGTIPFDVYPFRKCSAGWTLVSLPEMGIRQSLAVPRNIAPFLRRYHLKYVVNRVPTKRDASRTIAVI